MLNQVWASMFYIIFHVVLNVYELFGVYYGEQLVPFSFYRRQVLLYKICMLCLNCVNGCFNIV